MNHPLRIAGSAFALLLTVSSLSSQVVISEIEFQARNNEGQWIEIANLGQQTADLTNWSLYQATLTPNKPQNYWWGFPRGTTIAPGKFLRVHWLAKIQNSTATDVYTGDTVQHFLFGLFAEQLEAGRGALALFNTQTNSQMNDAARILDWVSWGTTGFRREDLAVANSKWVKDSAAPAATGSPAPTLAYTYQNLISAHSGSDWYRDFSPTPGADNLGGASVEVYGTTCQSSLTAPANLIANGLPINGNQDYYIGIDRGMGPNEFALAMFGLRGDGKLELFNCKYWLDPTLPAIVLVAPLVGNQARISFAGVPQDLLGGLKLASQWGIADIVADRLGFSNGIEMIFGK